MCNALLLLSTCHKVFKHYRAQRQTRLTACANGDTYNHNYSTVVVAETHIRVNL